MSQESESPLPPPPAQPTRELLLAQALELCIQAERRVPGSSDLVIGHQPAWARTDLRRLVALAISLDAVATNAVMSDEFRVAARARLMEHVGAPVAEWPGDSHGAWLSAVPSRNGFHKVRPGRSRRWLWRGSGGALLAAVLVAAASLTASANALPGEPLYSVKQAREELRLRFAPDDQARAWALLQQADTRLEETARLLQQGRTQDVAQTTQRFDDVLDRATTTLVVTIAESKTEAPAAAAETTLSGQEQRIQSMLVSAPEAARTDLAQALVTAERSRARVADRHPLSSAVVGPSLTENPSTAENPISAAFTPAPVAEPGPTPKVSEVRTLDVRIAAPEPAAAPEKHEASAPRRAQPQALTQPESHALTRGAEDGNDESPAVAAPANDGSTQVAEAQRSVSARVDDHTETAPAESAAVDSKPRNQPQQATTAKPAVVQAQNKTDSTGPATDHQQGRDAPSDAQQAAPAKSQPAPAARSNSSSASGDDHRPTNGESGAKGHTENSAAPTSHGGSDHGGGGGGKGD